MTRIRFSLDPLDEVVPWGGERRRLHWFGLTQGRYCLDVGDVTLLVYAPRDADPDPTRAWADYYVVRLWEDLLEVLPSALDPVPPDLAPFFAGGAEGWFGAHDPDVFDDPAVAAAADAHADRALDTGYLRFGPALRWWRTVEPEDTMHLAWRHTPDPDGEIVFAAPVSGTRSVPTAEFVEAITDFDRRLTAAMRDRIEQVAAVGTAPDVDLDLPALRREHEQRRTWLSRATSRRERTDWAAVRAGVATLTTSTPGRS
ncbi:DUF5984 family protein [Nocardia thailandica]|uniref:DUF5984 family protein n=1 Tax=Nocardia thailandica TaxID=257275 RepID=UPI0002FCBCEE|nr:DUF5984 family protein [Nocardia thailandica]